MILRRPYAILIKYFKVIHIIMFIFFTYLIFALRKIYMFFSNYIDTSTYVYQENMANDYIPGVLFLIVGLLLVFAISILSLMRKKEKPVLFYKIMITYSVLLLISLIYFITFFKSLDDTVYETLRIVINRDISLFFYLFNFFFVAFSFIRGFGFDIKKFSFDKDKKELHLDDTDSEEYELNVGLEKDDIKSFLNRHKREFGYYLKENKVILSIMAVIIILFCGGYFYYNVFVVNKVYQEKEDITIGKMTFRVNNSFISEVDKYGQVINPSDDYLIVDMNIINNNTSRYLDKEALRVHVNDDYVYPSISSCDLFSDIGLCYQNQELKANADINYIVIYRIPKEHSDIFLEVLKSKKNGYTYDKVKLEYKKIEVKDNVSNDKEFEINDKKYNIIKYELLEKTSYQYEECINEKCNSYKKIVAPDAGAIVLALEIDELNTLSDDFLNSAIGTKYNDIIYSGKSIRLIDKHNNIAYYSVPAVLNKTSSFTLLVQTRKIRYNIILGGE